MFHVISHYLFYSGDEEEEPAANVTAHVSMSQTLALSETHHTVEETSHPQLDLQGSTPATSPRASSPKRARIEFSQEFNIAGSSATPPLDDVSTTLLVVICRIFHRSEPFLPSSFSTASDATHH